MKSNRKKILFVLFLIVIALLAWRYVTLKRGQPETDTQITYREFFGLGDRQVPDTTPSYQPDFIDGGQGIDGGTVSPGGTGSEPQAPQSAFGDNPAFSPLGPVAIGTPSTPRSGTIGQPGTISSARIPTVTTDGTTGQLDFATSTDTEETLLCDPRDIALEFTPEEKERLRQLELQLLQMAPELRSAENVEDEISTYESFAIYGQKIAEQSNFCFEETAGFAVKPKRRPTPFWSDSSLDTPSFYSTNKAFRFGKENDETTKSYYYIEHLFNMNIW